MIAQRRCGPLIALVLAGLCLVCARLFQVQVREHRVWAREAANLVRTSETLPYHRGRIFDRQGRVLVEDDDAYEVELVYRNFRRDHPLGQVAHARSALERHAVSLHQAVRELLPWAFELVGLTPLEIEDFARGGPLELETLRVPPADPRAEQRAARAAELRFYTRELLGLTRGEWSLLQRRARAGEGGRSYLELAARVRGLDAEALATELAERLRSALARLEQLAWLIGSDLEEELRPITSEEALARLVERLQRTREGVEDAIASELFRAAAGFPLGRLGALALDGLDLGWIAESLRWSEERAERWVAAACAEWRANWRSLHVEAATIRATLGGERPFADRLLDELAELFAAPARSAREARERKPDWRATDRLVVLADLSRAFEGARGAAPSSRALLPFQDPALRAHARAGADPWEILAALVVDPGPQVGLELAAEDEHWSAPVDGVEVAERLRRAFDSEDALDAEARADRRLLPSWLVAGWEQRFESAVEEELALLRARTSGRLSFTDERREGALEQQAYVVRDRGSRPLVFAADPSYAVVQLLTRYPADFEGLSVRSTTRRRPVAVDERGRPIAPELMGVVRASNLRELIEQRLQERRLAELRQQLLRSEREREEMRALVAELYRSDELHGTSGIEGLFDRLLRGENGFREREGLEERAGPRKEAFFKPPVDGEDVVLALDLDLQRAALRTLENPVLPPEERNRDRDWFEAPVGAIVLISVQGEVLAAASVPREPGEPRPGRDGQRALVLERTARMYGFQPIGSVFKPFVAVHALDQLGLDPREELECAPLASRSGAGYGSVRCHSKHGHGRIALLPALHHSCNAYFAALGERVGSKARMLELARTFGFGEPTGLSRTRLGSGRIEDWAMPAFQRYSSFTPGQLQQAANGLAVLEGTPMQVARAFAGLATGVLPELRFHLVTSAHPATPGRALPFRRETVELVRRALVGVVREGSAAGKRLGPADLGFQLAAKTGSADYARMNDEVRRSLSAGDDFPDHRKHTWLAGWFPAEDPRAVVVVYLHDVAFTSSSTAVHVASQFLRSPEVARFVAEGRR